MPTTKWRRLIGVALSILLEVRLVQADDVPCYFPNRDRAYDFMPCGDAAATACCGPAQICLDNKYCMSIGQPFTLARGACTDQGWTSSACPSQCQDVFPNSAVAIILQKYENRISTYCCNSLAVIEGSDVPLCYDNTSTFQLPDAQVIPGRIALQNYTSVSESTATVSTTPSSTTSSSIDFTASTTNVHTSATTTSCSEMSDMSACKTGNHNVQIGVGVGVPLAAAAIAAVAWALWERRKRMGLKQQSAPAPVELSDQHPHHKPWGADITLQSPHSRYQSGTPSELGSGI